MRTNYCKINTSASAILPLAMSIVALAIVCSQILFVGSVSEADEGAAPRIFQLLIIVQMPVIGFFLFRWLLRNTIQALQDFAVHIFGIALAVGLVWYLNL